MLRITNLLAESNLGTHSQADKTAEEVIGGGVVFIYFFKY